MAIGNYANSRHCSTNWKNKAELEEYREELVSHFARSAELLDNMADDYRQIYQHMAKSSSNLLPGMSPENNPFRNRLAESEAGNDQAPVQMPRDYSEGHPACCVVAQSATNRTSLRNLLGAAIAPSASLPVPAII